MESMSLQVKHLRNVDNRGNHIYIFTMTNTLKELSSVTSISSTALLTSLPSGSGYACVPAVYGIKVPL